MTKLTIDPALRSKLTQPLEFTDDAGQTVGFFLTPDEHARLRQAEEEQRRLDYEHARALFTDEVIAAADASGGEYTYEEMMDHLRRADGADQAKSA
jgi:hypothetical protein